MKKILALSIILTFFFGSISFAGVGNGSGDPTPKASISGKILDQNTSEELAGVTIQVEGTDLKAYSDIDGNFRIDGVKPGTYTLVLSYISYKDKKLKDVNLTPSATDNLEIKLEQIN